nr:immunoglobulin heavy chain junction region [Mus musculus]
CARNYGNYEGDFDYW